MFTLVHKSLHVVSRKYNHSYKPSGENLQTLTDFECLFKFDKNSTAHFPSVSMFTFHIYEKKINLILSFIHHTFWEHKISSAQYKQQINIEHLINFSTEHDFFPGQLPILNHVKTQDLSSFN